MRWLLLSDLHSNLEALQAVLGYARGLHPGRLLILGDIVGYGPDPNAVVDTLRALPDLLAIRGNHDRVAIGKDGADDFNDAARASSEWTRAALRPDSRTWLAALPGGPRPFAPGRLMAHGSPVDEDQYLLDERTAWSCFEDTDFTVCFFGHTHYPCCFALDGGRAALTVARGADRVVFRLAPGRRYLINPGSVGQPRDHNPRASFALYDDETGEVIVQRVEYPCERTREKIVAAGLPRLLGDRLVLGV